MYAGCDGMYVKKYIRLLVYCKIDHHLVDVIMMQCLVLSDWPIDVNVSVFVTHLYVLTL